ncbi:MAG TPA: Gfo/Idh/MocA family oxidoreductase [Candidatus Bathyarchaeota archaeon]|nr:Gfo/Idh/MocA family oxidoreductase [Candidatus Bathyarchaeota archaeon]
MVIHVGFIGAGAHANRVHYPSIVSIDSAEIAAICDLNEEKLRATAEKYKVERTYTNYLDMIEKEELDCVYIIMPPHQLYSCVVDCLKAGLNVFIEKPPGITLNQTKSLAWYAKKYSCLTMVGFNRRFIPIMRKVRNMMLRRGDIDVCVASFHKNRIRDEPPYYQGIVDILTCDGIHAVDMLRWMSGGEAVNVKCFIHRKHVPYENQFYSIMEFSNGCIGVLMCNWAAGGRIHTFEMHAKGVSALIDPEKEALIYKDGDLERLDPYEVASSKDFYIYYGFLAENKHFIKCISKGEMPETSFHDAVKTMSLVDTILHSYL